MQGTLNEIDIRSILQLIELGQRTGELFVEAYSPSRQLRVDAPTSLPPLGREGEFWLVFFVNGQIVYAADRSNSSLVRLHDYLRRYGAEDALHNLPSVPTTSIHTPEYAYLWLLMERRILTPAQGRSILENTIKETLFDLLGLHQGIFSFEMGPALAPQLTTLEIAPLVAKIMKQVQQWKQFHPHIQSPTQCPAIADDTQLRLALPTSAYNSLYHWTDGQTSLRQLSRYLNRDLLTIARAIYPYIQRGWIQLLEPPPRQPLSVPPSSPSTTWEHPTSVPHIVCIDDDVTIGKSVEYILAPQGYQSTLVSNPLEALSLVFKLNPDLILCDIAMPHLDGYEVCAMLHSSATFRHTPIIMLTGKEGFVDRVRARMVGSTDYLTKPFGESELLMLVEKYIGLGIAQTPPQSHLPPPEKQLGYKADSVGA